MNFLVQMGGCDSDQGLVDVSEAINNVDQAASSILARLEGTSSIFSHIGIVLEQLWSFCSYCNVGGFAKSSGCTGSECQ